MPRPFPVIPRGPRRRRPTPETLLLACPRVAPDWELGALRALMKPQTRGTIAHRKALQPWAAASVRVVEHARQDVHARLGFDAELHFPAEGDYLFAAQIDRAACEEAKGLALVASKRLPNLWFVLGRTFIKGGRFYRRERRFKFRLVPASNVHLTRDVRGALRDLLSTR
jgi:hypothetical protein